MPTDIGASRMMTATTPSTPAPYEFGNRARPETARVPPLCMQANTRELPAAVHDALNVAAGVVSESYVRSVDTIYENYDTISAESRKASMAKDRAQCLAEFDKYVADHPGCLSTKDLAIYQADKAEVDADAAAAEAEAKARFKAHLKAPPKAPAAISEDALSALLDETLKLGADESSGGGRAVAEVLSRGPSSNVVGVPLSQAEGTFGYVGTARHVAEAHAVFPNHMHARAVHDNRERMDVISAEQTRQAMEDTVQIMMPDGTEQTFTVRQTQIWRQGREVDGAAQAGQGLQSGIWDNEQMEGQGQGK